jgi:hypothetical protein
MEWTRELPSKPGIYILRTCYSNTIKTKIVEVGLSREKVLIKQTEYTFLEYTPPQSNNGVSDYWYGPLEIPEFKN